MKSPKFPPELAAMAQKALFVATALGVAPAFAEEPAAPASQPVQAATAQTSEQAKMTLISVCADLGAGSKTLDSATAALQGGAGYGALDACAALHPIPFPGWNGIYFGGEANGRVSDQGWGVSAAEVELGYDFGRFGLDAGYGAYWDVLDGNRANTNVDGVPHTSVDLNFQPFPESSKFSPLSVECSLGSQWPQGTYFHPAYMDLHCGVGGTWGVVKVNRPKVRTNVPKSDVLSAVAVVEAPKVTLPPVETLSPYSMPEAMNALQMKRLLGDMKVQLDVLFGAYPSESPRLTSGSHYISEQTHEFFVAKYLVEKENKDIQSIEIKDYPNLTEKELATAMPSVLSLSLSAQTLDGLNPEIAFLEDAAIREPQETYYARVMAYVADAQIRGVTLTPALVSEFVLTQATLNDLKLKLVQEQALNVFRAASYERDLLRRKKVQQLGDLKAVPNQCEEDSPCWAQTEITRNYEEMRKKSSRNAHTGVLADYDILQDLVSKGGFLDYAMYLMAAQSARSLGDIGTALGALDHALSLKYSKEALDFQASLKNFGRVEINLEGEFIVDQYPFAPEERAAIDFVRMHLPERGPLVCYLPAGTYKIGTSAFEVKAGENNLPVGASKKKE